MNKKIMIKRILDIGMIILLLVLMSFQYTGLEIHEWMGTLMFLAVLVHQFLNRKWYATLMKGTYSAVRVLQMVLNLLLLIDIILMMITGMLMSGYVFRWLPIHTSLFWARKIHLAGAYWGFLFMSMHMGMHFGLITSAMKKRNMGTKIQALIKGLLVLICGYGGYAFIQQGIRSYLFLQTEFYQWGTAPNVWIFHLQNICIMITAGVICNISYEVMKR